jgi:hypothetical protein
MLPMQTRRYEARGKKNIKRAPRARTSCNTSNCGRDVGLELIHGTTDVDEWRFWILIEVTTEFKLELEVRCCF